MRNVDRRKKTIGLLLETTKALLMDKSCHTITLKDIMEHSKLSKGAIFHYVKSKDEIFAWVLQERLEETNYQFMNEVEKGEKSFDGPMQKIAANLQRLADENDITNQILMYLLDKNEDPIVKEVLHNFYDKAVYISKQWITTGQDHGVISKSVEVDQTAELFVLLSLGLRVRSSIAASSPSFTAADAAVFISNYLKAE